MTGIRKRSTKPGNGQSPIKDYSDWRIIQTDNEVIDGKKTPVQKSHPDIQGILDDIRKQPIPKVKKRKGKRK